MTLALSPGSRGRSILRVGVARYMGVASMGLRSCTTCTNYAFMELSQTCDIIQ